MVAVIEIIISMGSVICTFYLGIFIGRTHGTFEKFVIAVLESFKGKTNG